MASITTTIEPTLGVTVHTVEGEVTPEQVGAKIREYNAGVVARKVLWDFRQGRVPNLSSDQLQQGVRELLGDIQDLPGRRVALVTSSKLDFGLLRVWNALQDSTQKLEQQVFYDLEQALAWLDS